MWARAKNLRSLQLTKNFQTKPMSKWTKITTVGSILIIFLQHVPCNWSSFAASKFHPLKSTNIAQTLAHRLLVIMPRRTRNSDKLSSSSSSATTLKPPQDSSARKPDFHNNGLSPEKHNPTEKRSLVCGIPCSGSTKFPISRYTRAREVSTPRRSLRLSLLQSPNANQLVSNKISNCKPDDRRVVSSNEVKGEVEMKKVSTRRRSLRLSLLQGTNANQLVSNKTSDCKSDDTRVLSSNEVKGEVEMKTSNRSCVITFGFKAAKARVSAIDVCETNEQEINNNNRKRKRTDEANKRAVHEWTKEQEMVLQRAYFTTKPTPHFWKKVSRLVIKVYLFLFSASVHIFVPLPLLCCASLETQVQLQDGNFQIG